MLKDLFQRKTKYATLKVGNEENELKKSHSRMQNKSAVSLDSDIDERIWMKCRKCEEIVLVKDYEDNMSVCPYCGKHGRISAKKRIEITADEGSFEEKFSDIGTLNVLSFPSYEEKLEKARIQSQIAEAAVTGRAEINGISVNIGIMDSNFMMGSMGSAVGEKITRLIEDSAETGIPLILFCASGGARMQEGILSLMQMAKTSAAIAKLDSGKNLFISVLTDPTTGGVSASFAMLGDIIIAEPDALIGFAGPRVVEQTIRQSLPEGFQKSEFLLEKGFVDIISERKDMKNLIYRILIMHGFGEENENERE